MERKYHVLLEGFYAAKAGADVLDCPYIEPPDSSNWIDGWLADLLKPTRPVEMIDQLDLINQAANDRTDLQQDAHVADLTAEVPA